MKKILHFLSKHFTLCRTFYTQYPGIFKIFIVQTLTININSVEFLFYIINICFILVHEWYFAFKRQKKISIMVDFDMKS